MGPRDRSGGLRRSTRKRWAAQAFGLGIISLLGFMLLLQLRQDRAAALASATATADRLSRVLEAHTRETASAVGAVLAATAFHLRMSKRPDALHFERVRRILRENASSLPYLGALSFAGVDGRLIASTRTELPVSTDISSRDYFRRHAAGEAGLLMGSAVPSLLSNNVVLPISLRVETFDGAFAGVLVAVIDFRHFQAFYRTLRIGELGLVALYSGDHVMTLELPAGRRPGADAGVPTGLLFSEAPPPAAGAGTFHAETPLDGIDRIMGIRTVDGLSLGAVVGVSVEEALADWRLGARSHALVGLAAGLGVVGLTIALLGQMHRRDRASEALRAAGERLCRNEQHLTRAQTVSRMGSWELDLASGRVLWSPMMHRIFGQPMAYRPTLASIFELVGEEIRGDLRHFLDQAVAGSTPAGIEFDFTRPDGGTRRCRCKCEPVLAGGRTVAIIGTLQDVTEQRRAEAKRLELERQLQQAMKMEALGTLAGGIAHDLNNALVPVLGLTECVLESLPPGSGERADLEVVVQGATRARDLVRRILAFSRQEAPERRPVDVGTLLGSAWELLRHALPPAVTVDFRCASGALVLADPSQLHQVVVNLVTNAAQAIGNRAGTVTVTVAAADGEVRLSVADTGTGMDEAVRARVFEPFFTTKPVGEGTGLGLAVVHGIVSGHGGRIECRSRPGEGTVFDVHLPAFEAAGLEPVPCDFI
ncbi:PAS domain-containing protein [Skermanella mucosa]|uniref:ATP-binding protein n=1 Tax=Skermanella mucosa TaxID=1789672 RepID=UPI00192B7D96|nr:ATP-binding protein [Skermanella mucosa]UEM20596.1 PAS domain-containing protein [Skermanella mucosa]